jgi:hypothetical protein
MKMITAVVTGRMLTPGRDRVRLFTAKTYGFNPLILD